MSEQSDISISMIQKLGGTNYATWSVYMKAALQRQGLWNLVMEARGGGEETPDRAAARAAAEEKAKGILTLGVEASYLQYVGAADTAKQAWDILAALHASASKAQLVSLTREFSNLSKGADEAIVLYVSRAVQLQQKLKAAGKTVSDQDLVVQALIGLPEEYTTVRTILELSEDEDKLKLQNVQATLMTEEHRLSQLARNQHSGTALHVNVTSGKGNTETRRCFYCDKKGHIVADCRKKKADEKAAADKQDNSRDNHAGVNMAQTFML